ncbi:MAG: alpha/beta hydrolase, partial [Marinilabiliales bacterium]
SGFSLLHSHPFPDTNETIKKRLREIELVKEGKKDLIAKVNIPNAFAQENVKKFTKDIDIATQIALKTSEKGIIANLHAMMNRPDLSASLGNSELPFLLIAGKKDTYINFITMTTQISLPQNSEFCVLENSGHMGFIEEKEKTKQSIIAFLNSIKK